MQHVSICEGFLAVQKDEFLRLIINSIRNDLISRNESFQCLALGFVGNGEISTGGTWQLRQLIDLCLVTSHSGAMSLGLRDSHKGCILLRSRRPRDGLSAHCGCHESAGEGIPTPMSISVMPAIDFSSGMHWVKQTSVHDIKVILGRATSMGTGITQCALPADKWRCEVHRAQEGGHVPAAPHQEVAGRGGDPAARRLVGQAGAVLHRLGPLCSWQASHMTSGICRWSCFLLCCTF